MNNYSRFSISAAVKNAYLFVWRERAYLAKIALVPMVAQIACALFIQYERPGASEIEAYLWNLPSMLLLSWFLFVEPRLLILGERHDRLPADAAARGMRRRDMEASVLSLILFNMTIITAFSVLLHIEKLTQKPGILGALAGTGELLIIGALFWGARLGIVPVLAAVGHPIRSVLRKTWGAMFSLRLIGMALLGIFPVMIVFQLLLGAVLANSVPATGAGIGLSMQQQTLLNLLAAPLSLFTSSLLTAAAGFALKEILGGGRRAKT